MARVVKCPQLNVRQRTREVKADPTRWKRRMPSRYDQARHGQVDKVAEACGLIERRPEVERSPC